MYVCVSERKRERISKGSISSQNIGLQIIHYFVLLSLVQKTLTSEGGESGRYPPEGLKEPAPDGMCMYAHALLIFIQIGCCLTHLHAFMPISSS
jgi:hypothetical protein